MRKPVFQVLLCSVLLGVLGGGLYRLHSPRWGPKTLPGRELFAACATCHGVQGEGNVSIQAPSIAALPAWYVEVQLLKFRTGARGAHPDDLEGLRMRPMSQQR